MDMIELEPVPKTAIDVFRLLPEGTLCEVIDNVLYMGYPRSYSHQRLLGLLIMQIGSHVDKYQSEGIVVSFIDVYFDELGSAVQPDILFVAKENLDIIKEDDYIHGAPDLIVEVLGDEDIARDTIMKKSLYERAGVKEYFIANPKNKKVQCFILKDGNYELSYEAEGKFNSALLGFSFDF